MGDNSMDWSIELTFLALAIGAGLFIVAETIVCDIRSYRAERRNIRRRLDIE